ncbi:MAG TPA: helix-turn-helix transcriptional regulator [Pseudolabrys sp.]|nr:helix-turn-helix transcriptional regulator [Pseudolabrys sp.]
MKKRPDPIDVLVGNNIRILRLEKGLSQGDLAGRLGITFQQVQKYEKGINRIGSGRLARLSQVLGVSVGRFFQGSEIGVATGMPPEALTDLLAKPYAIRMLKALAGLPNNAIRLSLVQLAETMAGLDDK